MGGVRYMAPTDGPEGWRALLADPELHWKKGRSARTLAYAWESADGWPDEVQVVLARHPKLADFEPVFGFPEFETPLPGGARASQTDLTVLAADGQRRLTVAVEGKVDEPFGDLVEDWLGDSPSQGKKQRLAFLADTLTLAEENLPRIRYQLIHRTAAARLEAERNGSEVAMMLVHSWAANGEGFGDYSRFVSLLGIEAAINRVEYSESADLWVGWVAGDPAYLNY